jgi:hypothetical protein
MRSGSVEGAVTGLVENEALWGNLMDGERRQCMAWAERRLSEALERETAYVRGVLSTLNQLMERDPLDRDDVIPAVLGE